MMVIFNDSVHLDDAMFVSLDFFEDVVSLDLGENFYDGLLETGTSHQRSIVWSRESFLSDFNLLNRLHSVTDLVVHLIHKVANSIPSSSSSFGW